MNEQNYSGIEKFDDMQICNMCSKWSPKEKWINDKCPACGQVLILPDEAEQCQGCGFLSKKQNIIDGRCPRCR